MYSFRDLTPKRRENRKECKHYSSYNKTLQEDFNARCGYCNSDDKLRIRSFTIDHFIPQIPDEFTHDIKPNYYYNLVYSCRYCNSAKSNKWPTGDPNLCHNGSLGFMETTSDEYTTLFKRDKEGKLLPSESTNLLALYIIKELKLWLPVHSNMWKLERVKKLNKELELKLKSLLEDELREETEYLHYQVLKEIEEIQNAIFVENE